VETNCKASLPLLGRSAKFAPATSGRTRQEKESDRFRSFTIAALLRMVHAAQVISLTGPSFFSFFFFLFVFFISSLSK
jgi:hypothetical protein